MCQTEPLEMAAYPSQLHCCSGHLAERSACRKEGEKGGVLGGLAQREGTLPGGGGGGGDKAQGAMEAVSRVQSAAK